jgi:hypothetical protein
MKKLPFLFCVIALNCFSQTPSIQWGGNIGEVNYDNYDVAGDICSDVSGNIYITGQIRG